MPCYSDALLPCCCIGGLAPSSPRLQAVPSAHRLTWRLRLPYEHSGGSTLLEYTLGVSGMSVAAFSVADVAWEGA